MTNTSAEWIIELTCECPKCKSFFDLLRTPDFLDGRKLEMGEWGTDRSRNIKTYCPECEYAFMVDCVY